MTDHPLTPDPVKKYLQEQNLEVVMNTGINKILREKPADALSALAVYLTSNAEKKPVFSKFECEETLISGKYSSFQAHIFIDYAGEVKSRHTHTYTYESEDGGDGEEAQNALRERVAGAMQMINNDINSLLNGADLSLIKKTDLQLKKFFDEKYPSQQTEEGEEAKGEGQSIGKIVLRVVSEAIVHGVAKCYQNDNMFDNYSNLLTGSNVELSGMTKLMFTVLNGGKSVSSKVKFSKIYLILGASKEVSVINSFLKIQKAIVTSINSSKQGTNGFKMGADGSYFNACDSIPEALKILEDAIKNSNVNTDQETVASIGINCESESFYNAETNKYDMEGPKNLFEPGQMADWYIKFLGDHPLITYIEDPFSEITGYQMFPEKLQEHSLDKTISFGVKNFYQGKLEKLKEFTEYFEKEQEDDEAEGEGDKVIILLNWQDQPEAEGEGNHENQEEGAKDAEDKKEDTPAEGDQEQEEEDPNKDKFFVNSVHVTKGQYLCYSDILDLLSHGNSQKAERKFGLVVEDNYYESTASDIVNLAVGMGAKYLNIKGINSTEKIAKV